MKHILGLPILCIFALSCEKPPHYISEITKIDDKFRNKAVEECILKQLKSIPNLSIIDPPYNNPEIYGALYEYSNNIKAGEVYSLSIHRNEYHDVAVFEHNYNVPDTEKSVEYTKGEVKLITSKMHIIDSKIEDNCIPSLSVGMKQDINLEIID